MKIAIDGPAGSGKSTTAKYLAEKLDFLHINTGSMYRAIAYKCIKHNIDLEDSISLNNLLNSTKLQFDDNQAGSLHMDGKDISTAIRTKTVTDYVSLVSSIQSVRNYLVMCQRNMSQDLNVVLEGRDIGTVVFPKADYKFFLIADIEERAMRRKKELNELGNEISLNDLILEISERDRKDSNRKYSPLKKAKDAIEIDTTGLTIEQQVNSIAKIINKTNK